MRTKTNNHSAKFVLLAVISLLTACANGNDGHKLPNENFIKTDSVSINSKDLENRTLVDVNTLFDSISYIPLETTKTSLFSQINQLEVTKDYFIILDWTTNSILVFDKVGRYKFRIKGRNIRQFTIDPFKSQIVFQDHYINKVYCYNFKGQFINSWKNPFLHTALVYIDSNKVLSYRYFVNKNDSKFGYYNLLESNERGKITKGWLPYDTAVVNYREVYGTEKKFYKSGKDIFFIQPYENKIYNITANAAPTYFELKLPEKYSLPADFLTSKRYYNKRFQYIKNHNDQTAVIKNFYKVGQLMVFETMANYWTEVLLYHEKLKRSVLSRNLASGPGNYQLPIGNAFYAADSISFYRAVTAKDLLRPQQLAYINRYADVLPANLKKFYETGNNLSNPVILQLFPKKALSVIKTIVKKPS